MHYWMNLLLLAALAMMSGAEAPAAAQDADGAALLAKLKERDATVQTLVATADTSSTEVKEKLKEIINGVIDFDELSKRALGKHWRERTEAEQADFVEVFRQLIRNSSVRKLDIYKADRVEYEEPTFRRGIASIRTVAHKKDSQMEVVYQLHQVDGEWLVYDLVVDEVSTARNYRDGFYKKLAKTPFSDMMVELREKLDEGTDEGAETL